MLAGVAPIPANSGQVTTRYRLNRYGDRQLNNALHTGGSLASASAVPLQLDAKVRLRTDAADEGSGLR